MSEEITRQQFVRWLQRYAEYVKAQEAYLSELDAAIGDGDHGTNMVRGIETIESRLSDEFDRHCDIGTLMRNVAMTLISSVGGAAGPLYGAFFLRAAKSVNTQETISLQELAVMFRSGLEGVQQRGKAVLDEKTMIDAIQPGVEALEEASTQGQSIQEALELACQAAKAGMKHTIELQAYKGRASYLGVRSIGHQDPGATSSYFLFLAAQESMGTAD
ncbi:MAG: dihydroxyacetone kinase subunit L [Caldilineaceae bacterium]|nr:dihydroxyacetone kinase subunit L [Caldilineaceae bacterium]